jgi:hypothetical protein
MHDKAFELGFFTVDAQLCVRVNCDAIDTQGSTWARANLLRANGKRIRAGIVAPSSEALQYHWARVHVAVAGVER